MIINSWVEYARIQKLADSCSILNDRAWGSDDALEGILDRIETGQTVSSSQADNLVTNRTAKYRQRRALVGAMVPMSVIDNTGYEQGRLLARYRLDKCSSQCSLREWQILLSLGFGETYDEISNRHGVPMSTLKTWVHRVRQRLVT